MRKKIISLLSLTNIVIFSILLIFVFAVVMQIENKAFAMELDNDNCDAVFVENVSRLAEENYNGDVSINATKEVVFDINMHPLGFVYDFSVNGEEGYAIVIHTSGDFEVAELYFNAFNPYKDLSVENRIFVTNMFYLYNVDEVFYVVGSNVPLAYNQLNEISNIALYSDGGNLTYSTEQINYSSKNENKFTLAKRYPGIFAISGYPNSCAPIAGANIIQYWDRYKTDLIPDYTPGVSVGSSYLYKEPNNVTNNVISQLYTDMTTNSTGIGTTIDQFKSGLTKYCDRYNQYVTFSTCMSNSTFNYMVAKQYLIEEKPIVLFLDKYHIAEIVNSTNEDTINYMNSEATHVVVGFGYNEITYTLSEGNSRVDKYIAIGAGLITRQRGYLNIAYNLQIDDAYSISIS